MEEGEEGAGIMKWKDEFDEDKITKGDWFVIALIGFSIVGILAYVIAKIAGWG